MSREDWISLVPGEEQGLAGLLAELQSLAEHPGHVRTSGAANELLVPPYLASRYMPAAPKRRRTKKEEGED